MASNLKSLLGYYDAFGWIPTIRGALSLDLMGGKNQICGQADKYAVSFPDCDGLSTNRFVAGTSYNIVSDSKFGKDITRTFRYFFYGTIHSKEDGDRILECLEFCSDDEKNEVRKLIETEGVLIGRLIIRKETPSEVSSYTISIINKIQELINFKEDYNFKFNIDAVSFNELKNLRNKMHARWIEIRDEMSRLINESNSKNERIRQYEFEVLLTRDGIILIKDCSCPDFKVDYFEANSPSDYTQNVALHRIFKNAMNFIKYLFHSNYHHDEDNDTFLPASNLHPYKHSDSKDFSRIFKHQIDAFLNPIMKMRKGGFQSHAVDSNGILNYAKSFTYTCYQHGLIDEKFYCRELRYIELLDAEVDHASRHNKSLLNSIASQRSLFFILTTVLAFAVASLSIFESALQISNRKTYRLLVDNPWYITAVFVIIICLIGYVLFELSYLQSAKREFHKKYFKKIAYRIKTWIFFRNSNYEKGQLSCALQLYLKIQELWHLPYSAFYEKFKQKSGKKNSNASLAAERGYAIILFVLWMTLAFILFYYVKVIIRGMI